ncbi:MAG: DUF4129 domain-containing protein [Chloroflexota bacterium]
MDEAQRGAGRHPKGDQQRARARDRGVMMRQFVAERPLLQRLLTWGTMLLVVAALLVLANTLPHAEFRRGNGLFELLDELIGLFSDRSAPEPLIFPPLVWNLISAIFWLTLILVSFYMIFSKNGRREIPGMIRLLLRGFILAWIVLFILQISQPTEEEETEQTSGERADTPFDDLETTRLQERLDDVLLELPEQMQVNTALVIAGIIFAVALSLGLWRWWQYQRTLKSFAELPVDELRLRALQALHELRQGDVPLADVIRRCYREMVQTVQEQRGVYRERHTTPREFEERLLKVGFPQPPVERLTRLFEQVRYGHASVGEREKRQAIDSLEQIVAACEQLGQRGRGR